MKTLARLSAGAVSTVLVIALAGCNNSSSSADPDPGESSASSPTEASSESPTESPEPTVAPADGELIETRYFSVRAPKGFVYEKLTYLTSMIYRARSDDAVTFSVFSDSPESSLDRQAHNLLKARGYVILPKQVEDTVIDGRPVWHATGPIDDYHVADLYGLWINGASVAVTFDTLSTNKRRTELIESILATWTWK